MTNPFIRPATAADIERLIEVVEIVAAEGRYIAQEPPIDRVERRRDFEERIGDPRAALLVAEVDGSVAGFAGLRERFEGVLYLGMALVPEARGRGLGAALLKALLEWARTTTAHKIALEVWPDNTAAIRLYERFGFDHEGYLKAHYRRRNGEVWDSVIMGLPLA